MEHKTWKVEIDGERHEIRPDWTYWGGRREVFEPEPGSSFWER